MKLPKVSVSGRRGNSMRSSFVEHAGITPSWDFWKWACHAGCDAAGVAGTILCDRYAGSGAELCKIAGNEVKSLCHKACG